jgi:hypothetical protein
MAAGAALSPDDDDAIQNASAPAMPPVQGAAPASGTPTAPPQAQPAPGQPSLAATPQGGIAQGTGNTKGEITTPPVQMKFDPKKLQQAQTTLDVLNAATASSRKQYMDWWQQQHGDIDDKYDDLKKSIGARPSDDEPETQKEKFAALLEFGLHLMKNSATPSTTQGAVLAGTLSSSLDQNAQTHQANIAAKQKTYDQSANAIESARDEEQKGIGTPAQAMNASALQAKDDAGTVKDQSAALKNINDVDTTKASALGRPIYATTPGGVVHALVRNEDGTSTAQPVTGIDGKPFVGRVLGNEAGSGIQKGATDTAAIRNQKYLTDVLGVDKNTAAQVAFKQKTGNPNADHAAIYKQVLSTTMGDTDKAMRVANQYVLDQYGPGAVAKANAPMVATGAPPPQAVAGLKPGMIRDFGVNGKWTVGIDGKPVRVGAGPQSIQ